MQNDSQPWFKFIFSGFNKIYNYFIPQRAEYTSIETASNGELEAEKEFIISNKCLNLDDNVFVSVTKEEFNILSIIKKLQIRLTENDSKMNALISKKLHDIAVYNVLKKKAELWENRVSTAIKTVAVIALIATTAAIYKLTK